MAQGSASAQPATARAPVGSSGLRGRLWIRLLLASLVPSALILTGMGLLAHQAARLAMEEQLGKALCSVARTAASQMARRRALDLRPGDEPSRTHRNLVERLEELRRTSDVRRIVLFDTSERCLVDSDGACPIGEPLAELAANRAELQDVLRGRDRASVLFSGRDGTLYKTGFAPVVFDGRVEAVVGVDGSATFFGPLNQLGRTLAVVGAVALLLVVMVSLLVSRAITRPLDRLALAARAIGAGELQHEIRVETADEIGLLADRLNEMRKAILARDQQMQLMLSGIAHEVRNPLGGMTLFVGLLREELSEPASLGHVERIARELDYLSRVVNDFLDFARRKPPQIEAVDPRQELDQVCSLCQSLAAEAGVALDCRVAEDVRSASWDPERIRRALLNLVRNAIQASTDGGRVELQLHRAPDGGIQLSVSDQGCGIPAELQVKVFDPFFTTRQRGTGLGLALVRKTVEDHAGTIELDSQPGRGTRFTIRLPPTADRGPRED